MKKLIVLMFLIITNSSFSQLEVYLDTTKNESPNESWTVNKRYDKDGNITQYDSSYSYSYSSGDEYLNIDSLISTFGMNNFFSSPFKIDSTFNFFNQRSGIIEDVFKEFIQIDSFFNDFFDDNFSKPKPKPRKKKTGTHI